ncbi:hypothetical protein QOZ80_5BG0440800 [Eleusine coracana subsp. coracana]|nr:hypothetical protein QOZ80_5BG0440800 [Eleusine coracana subsp. coracana]
MFMFMLSHNASYEDLQYEFKHSGETIHRHINAVFGIIPALTYRFLKPTLTAEPHLKITTDSCFFPYFENCLGAIDGTHVPITIAEAKQAPYRNRKGTLSQNVMLACDFDLNFTFISCGLVAKGRRDLQKQNVLGLARILGWKRIQDKEKELKRDFRVLKEARKQSGVHWDEKLCMIMAESAIWNNIIVSHPKASKFQRQGFPLYDDLERLYDGKTAEGNLAFISITPKDDDVRVVQALKEQVTHDGAMGSLASLSGYSDDEDDGDNDEDVQIVHPPKQISTTTSSRRNAFTSSRDKRAAAEKDVEPTASGATGAKFG